MEDNLRNFTRSDLVEGNAHVETAPNRKFRQISLDSGIADEEVPVKVNFNLDLDYDMSEDEDDDFFDEDM